MGLKTMQRPVLGLLLIAICLLPVPLRAAGSDALPDDSEIRAALTGGSGKSWVRYHPGNRYGGPDTPTAPGSRPSDPLCLGVHLWLGLGNTFEVDCDAAQSPLSTGAGTQKGTWTLGHSASGDRELSFTLGPKSEKSTRFTVSRGKDGKPLTAGFVLEPAETGQVDQAKYYWYQPGPEVYFLSIGLDNYADNALEIRPINGSKPPGESARQVADILKAHGARGVLLRSHGQLRIGREDIKRAITALKSQIREDRAVRPVIFVYLMGHGLGDTFSRYLYVVPENLKVGGGPRQTLTMPLIKSSLWNYDLINSLIMFRTHNSMKQWDDVFQSDMMPNIADPDDTARSLAKAQELIALDEQLRAAGRYPPEGNPPVPFVVLLDNCYLGVASDVVEKQGGEPSRVPGLEGGLGALGGAFADAMLAQTLPQMRELESDGLVAYAAEPGKQTGDYPDKESGRKLGLLALRFKLAEAASDHQSMTIGELRKALLGPQGDLPKPYSISDTSEQIQQVVLFGPPVPDSQRREYQKMDGTAKDTLTCCAAQ